MDDMSSKHEQIMRVVKEENLEELNVKLQGIEGVAKALGITDTKHGIANDKNEIDERRKKFGSNTFKKPRPKGFFRSIWRPLEEFVILSDLMNIFAAFILYVAASAIGSYTPSRNEDKIEVLRGGERHKVSIFEIVVGDVVCLKIGDKVPADGLFLKGHNLSVESMTDDEGENVNKQIDKNNPFLFSGSQVVDGCGSQMIVTAVGMKPKWCDSSERDEEITTVGDRVYELTRSIRSKVGLPIAILGFIALLARYFTGNTKDYQGNQEFIDGGHRGNFLYSSLLEFIGTAFTTVVVVIPESLRLGVALNILYSKKRMMAGMEMVSDISLSGYETMGSVTTICTNKTGTLTMNQMKVTKLWLGEYSLENEPYFANASRYVKNLLEEGIALNTSTSRNTSPIDKAILSWAVCDLDVDIMEVKSRCTILLHDHHVDHDEAAFNNSHGKKKRCGVLMKREVDNTVHVHWKGEAEAILEMCSSYYDNSFSGTIKDLNDNQKEEFRRTIQHMAVQCIAFAHHQVEHQTQLKEDGLVLLGLVAIKGDSCRPKMKEAVEDCKNAGVDVKMITGDDVSTAIDIAKECGILTGPNPQEGEVIKGEEFPLYSQQVDRIRVMANSSANDKLQMVKTLKKQGHIVAVCGNSTNDVLALLEADVGISMGIKAAVTNAAKKISGIVVFDGNFASVARLLKPSICIYNNMQKFIQFELTLNIAALAIIFLSAVSAGEILLYAGEVLWLNLIVSTLASLALATQKPTQEPIKRQPVGRKQPLISNIMLRNLLAQLVYQIVVVSTLLLKAKSITRFDEDRMAKLNEGYTNDQIMERFIWERNTLIFHAFLLCQVFNEFNARNLESIKNVFKGIHRDIEFLLFIAITISLQVVFLEFLLYRDNNDYYFVRLELWQWGICFGIAVISWPIDWVVKCIPVPQRPLLSYLCILWRCVVAQFANKYN